MPTSLRYFLCLLTSAGAKAAHVPDWTTHRALCVIDALRGYREVKPGSCANAQSGGAFLVFFCPPNNYHAIFTSNMIYTEL